MSNSASRTPNILLWTLAFGLAFNILGWLGNNLLLGDAWDAASEGVKAGFTPPWPPVVKEGLSLASDFVYAFVLVWLFANARTKSVLHALKLAFMVWLGGVVVTYLAIVNAGFLPADIAVKTSLLALAVFLAGAPLLPVLVRDRSG